MAGLGRTAGGPDTAYGDEEWTFEQEGVEDDNVAAFADATGDTNRVHLDESFAERTRFGGRIAHGVLTAGVVSAALARLPGLTIYLSQELCFLGPVGIGETVTAVCEVVETLGGGTFRIATTVYDQDGDPVVDGEAVVLVDDLPAKSGADGDTETDDPTADAVDEADAD